jgi:tRNA(adenine34) deaminase
MQQALLLAKQAGSVGEVPVGSIVVLGNKVLGCGFNQPIGLADPTGHAEIQALRQAAKRLQNYRLVGATLYVTLEPCSMCAGALVHARIKRLVFGAKQCKSGAVVSQNQLLNMAYLNHSVDYIGGVCEDQCLALLKDFFAERRKDSRGE